MFGMNQGPMTSMQIMNILNQNQMMKMMTYTLIQNQMMMNQMINILNSLVYNPMLLNEMKNFMNQDLNMMNMNNMMNNNMMNMININKIMEQMTNNMNNIMNVNNMKNIKMDEIKNNDLDNMISVVFKKRSWKIFVLCRLDDKISDIIQRYRNKTLDNDEHLHFLYNGKGLEPSRTIAQSGIINGSLIYVIELNS